MARQSNLFVPALIVSFRAEPKVFCYHSYFRSKSTAEGVLSNMVSMAKDVPGLLGHKSWIDERDSYYPDDTWVFDKLLDSFKSQLASEPVAPPATPATPTTTRWSARLEEEDDAANWFTYDAPLEVTPEDVAVRAFEYWETQGVYRDNDFVLYNIGDWVRCHEGPVVVVTGPTGTTHEVRLWIDWAPTARAVRALA